MVQIILTTIATPPSHKKKKAENERWILTWKYAHEMMNALALCGHFGDLLAKLLHVIYAAEMLIDLHSSLP